MTIHFYLNTEEETEIVTFYDMIANPFKIGDEVKLKETSRFRSQSKVSGLILYIPPENNEWVRVRWDVNNKPKEDYNPMEDLVMSKIVDWKGRIL